MHTRMIRMLRYTIEQKLVHTPDISNLPLRLLYSYSLCDAAIPCRVQSWHICPKRFWVLLRASLEFYSSWVGLIETTPLAGRGSR